MASRKEQKEQARAARIAQEQQSATKARKTRRLQIFGGVIVAAVIVIVVAIVVSSGSSNSPKGAHTGLVTGRSQQQLVSQVDTLLAGIPQRGATLGNPSAKVTMEYFGDLECPICQQFTLDVFQSFIQKQVRTGNVKVVYRSMCTATCGPRMSQSADMTIFNRQQVAALAAGKQNKFWQYIELFYHQQKEENSGYATDTWLAGIAKQVTGLSLQTWQSDRKDPSLLSQVTADQKFATSASLPGTPALIMRGPTGKETLVNGGNLVTSESQLDTAVKAVS